MEVMWGDTNETLDFIVCLVFVGFLGRARKSPSVADARFAIVGSPSDSLQRPVTGG
jgi:hypothetical protein